MVVDLIVHEARLQERQCDRAGKVEPSCSHTPSSIPFSPEEQLASWPFPPFPTVEHWAEHGGLWGEQDGDMVATVSKMWDRWHPGISILKK